MKKVPGVVLLALALTGCAETSRVGEDPLLGGLKGRSAAPVATAPPPRSAPATLPAPLPASGAAPSLATLASGLPPRGNHATDMRIGDNATLTSGTTQPGIKPQQPQFSGGNAGGPTLGTPTSVPSATATSVEQAQGLLKARGVRWQKSDRGTNGEWKLSCGIPRKQYPNTIRTYEATATTELGALQAILERIQRDEI